MFSQFKKKTHLPIESNVNVVKTQQKMHLECVFDALSHMSFKELTANVVKSWQKRISIFSGSQCESNLNRIGALFRRFDNIVKPRDWWT